MSMHCLFGQVLLDFRTGLQVSVNGGEKVSGIFCPRLQSGFPIFSQELIDAAQ